MRAPSLLVATAVLLSISHCKCRQEENRNVKVLRDDRLLVLGAMSSSSDHRQAQETYPIRNETTFEGIKTIRQHRVSLMTTQRLEMIHMADGRPNLLVIVPGE